MPSASAIAFIEDAVPIVLQWPALGADAATRSMNSLYPISPRARRRLDSQMTSPEPARRPLYQPLSIGPPDRTIAGMLTVAAAHRQAGVVLSHPVVSTTPSNGYPYSTSTSPRYAKLRSSDAVGRLPVSCSG